MYKSQPALPKRSFFRRLVRIVGRTLLTIFLILLIVFFLIQTPYIQNIVRGKAEIYLSRKLKTRVRIGDLNVSFFQSVTLKNVYFEDRQRDTLLSAGLIDVQVRMLGLLHNHLDIGEVHLEDVTVKLIRQLPDTAFNYQFIVDAFSGSPSPPPEKKTGQPLKMDLRELELDKIRFVYKDTVSGADIDVWVGHSLTRIDGIDLDRLRFSIPEIEMEGVQGRVWEGRPLAVAASGGGTPGAGSAVSGGKASADSASGNGVQLILGKVDLKNSGVDYRDFVGKLSTNVQLSRLLADVRKVDLDKENFQVSAIQLDSAEVRFDDNKQPRQKRGMDYAHLNVHQLSIATGEAAYSSDSISGTIKSGSFSEQSGFQLTRLRTKFFYSDRRAWLSDLLLQTPGTLLQRNISLQYDSVAGMLKNPRRTLVNLDLAGSRVQVKDILTFAPFLQSQPAFSRPQEVWAVTAQAGGSFDAIRVRTLQVSGIRDLRLDMAGVIRHPFDSRRIQGDIDFRNLSGSRVALVSLVPKGTLPSNISIPDRFDLHGRLAGSMDAINTDLLLNTSSGKVIVKGFARNFRSTTGASYDLSLATRALNLGAILRDSAQWGAVTANFTLQGRGLDIHSAHSKFTGKITSATYRHYAYHNLLVAGSIADQQATLQSSINNTAVHFELQASADLSSKFPALKLDWQVDTLDLHAMGLTTDTLQFKGHVAAQFEDTNPDSLEGALRVTKMDLLQGHQHIVTDSVVLLAAREEDREHIQLHTEMADLDLNGHYLLTQLPTALEHTISQYYTLPGFKDTAFAAEDWTLRMRLRISPLVLTVMPFLKGTDTVGGVLTYNSARNDLQLGLKTQRVVLGTQFLHDVNITAGTSDSSLDYNITLADGHGSGFLLYKTAVYGAVAHNRLTTTLLLKDKKDKDRYRLAGILDDQHSALKFSFDPDSLMLNYDRWAVSRDNSIQYDSTGVIAHDFTLSNNGDSLSLNSEGSTGASSLDIRFGNFRLSTLSRLANQDSVMVDGLLNGTARVKNVTTNPVFTSDLKILNLSYKTDTLGDLAVKVNNEKANAFSADIGLQGKNNDIAVSGDYYMGDSSKMDLRLDLRRVNLSAFTKAAEGTIDNMKGYMMGKFTIQGTIDKPVIRGNFYFDSAVITPTISGEALNISKDRIAFDEDGFNFDQFTLRDSAGNKLILDGNVFTKDYHTFGFDLSLNAQNFRMVNAPESGTRQFYGQLNLDAAINLEGKMDAPKIDGDIRVNKRTNFFYVLPADDPEVSDRVGVVRFVDHRTGDTVAEKKVLAVQTRNTQIKGLDVSLNLLTDTSAVLNVVIDPNSGDALNVRGRSNLVFQLEKSGKMDLTGTYEVNGGYYSLSLSVLKRKFNIQPGSVITWTGDPTIATVNLTATYTELTPSIDLVSNIISILPQDDQYKFRQKLPFLVTLKMTGDMLKPDISFDISLPTTVLTLYPEVDQRLAQLRNQPSDLNEQVFALLLLGRFVGDDPLTSDDGGGSTVGNLAFSSAAQILTSQMDQIAASLIKQVDIHFDLNDQQDWSTGKEIDYTELDLTVSKHFMEDRLQVSVGSSFDVVGTGAPNQAPSNLAGDVDAAYKLTKDGRYLVRAYRQNQYEAVVVGQVIETGVGFVFTFNYDKFKEIWHRAKGDTIEVRKTSNSSTTKPSNSSTTSQ